MGAYHLLRLAAKLAERGVSVCLGDVLSNGLDKGGEQFLLFFFTEALALELPVVEVVCGLLCRSGSAPPSAVCLFCGRCSASVDRSLRDEFLG